MTWRCARPGAAALTARTFFLTKMKNVSEKEQNPYLGGVFGLAPPRQVHELLLGIRQILYSLLLCCHRLQHDHAQYP